MNAISQTSNFPADRSISTAGVTTAPELRHARLWSDLKSLHELWTAPGKPQFENVSSAIVPDKQGAKSTSDTMRPESVQAWRIERRGKDARRLNLSQQSYNLQSHVAGRPKSQAGNLVGVFKTEARFEGRVVKVSDSILTAHVADSGGQGNTYAHVEIPLDDVPPSDRHLAVPGATFYWLIGYERLPQWKKSMILTFVGHKRLSSDEIQSRKANLLEFFKPVTEHD